MTLQLAPQKKHPVTPTGAFLPESERFMVETLKTRDQRNQVLTGDLGFNNPDWLDHLKQLGFIGERFTYYGGFGWSWWYSMLLAKEQGTSLLTPRQWSETLLHAETKGVNDLVSDMIGKEGEWTRSVVVFPGTDGKPSPDFRLQLPAGAGTVFLEYAQVVLEKGKLLIDLEKGEPTKIENFPEKPGILKEGIPELGLPAGSWLSTRKGSSTEAALRPIFRGSHVWEKETQSQRRFATYVFYPPRYSQPSLGFRLLGKQMEQ
jgi:hypothetical protein